MNASNSFALFDPTPQALGYAKSPRPAMATKAPIFTKAPPPVPVAPLWRVWATGFGASENISGDPVIGSASQNNNVFGGSLGVDYRLFPNMLIGLAAGGSDGRFSVNDRATSGSTRGGHIAFYTMTTWGAAYLQSTTAGSFFDNTTTRTILPFGGLGGEVEHGSFSSNEIRSRYEFGYRFNVATWTLTPFAAIEAARLSSDGFTETPVVGPGLFALNVQAQHNWSVPTFVGGRVNGTFAVGNGMWLTPSLQVAWVHEFDPARNQTGALINLPGAVFLTDGARPASDAAQVKAGAELVVRDNLRLSANFDGEFSNRGNTYAGKGAVKVSW